MVKEYINKDGYKIKASERAYNLLYRKNGFLPVDAGGTVRAETSSEDEGDVTSEKCSVEAGKKSTAGKPRNASTGKKASGGNSNKASTVQTNAASDQDAAGQSESDMGYSGDEETSYDTESAGDAAAMDTAEKVEDEQNDGR